MPQGFKMNGLEDHLINEEGTRERIDTVVNTLKAYLQKEKWRTVDFSTLRGGIHCPEHGDIEVDRCRSHVFYKEGNVVVLRRKGGCCDKYPMPYVCEAEAFSFGKIAGYAVLTDLFRDAFSTHLKGKRSHP